MGGRRLGPASAPSLAAATLGASAFAWTIQSGATSEVPERAGAEQVRRIDAAIAQLAQDERQRAPRQPDDAKSRGDDSTRDKREEEGLGHGASSLEEDFAIGAIVPEGYARGR